MPEGKAGEQDLQIIPVAWNLGLQSAWAAGKKTKKKQSHETLLPQSSKRPAKVAAVKLPPPLPVFCLRSFR